MSNKNRNPTQDERMRVLLDIVQRLFYDSEENSVRITDIIKEAEIDEIAQKETEETLEQLRRYGLINKLPNGKYTLR
jgi:DNA replicative helicase MCM subunit Mcm2 (Cdc46/Mcm family)